MEPLLFLVHRLPYPPNKGDKIRSFNLLKQLAARFHVHLGTLLDDPADEPHIATLADYCASLMVGRLHPRWQRVRSLLALGSGAPLSLRYFFDRRLQQWVDDSLRRQRIERVLVFSSTMAQYVLPRPAHCRVLTCDMVDVDSMKWLQYAERTRGLMRVVYRREGRTLAAYERRVASACDRTSFVSAQEAELFLEHNPDLRAKVYAFRNGVDLNYFDPAAAHANPYPRHGRPIAFTGAMDYWANIDAVTWFVREVLPRVRVAMAAAEFYIVGSNPAAEVQQLARHAGVTVTGRVDDIRPYLQHAECVVAPLRIARGLQNKVLEAMAMNKPVIATTDALVGIAYGPEAGLTVADSAESFAAAVLARLAAATTGLAACPQGRELVAHQFSWAANLAELDATLAAPVAA